MLNDRRFGGIDPAHQVLLVANTWQFIGCPALLFLLGEPTKCETDMLKIRRIGLANKCPIGLDRPYGLESLPSRGAVLTKRPQNRKNLALSDRHIASGDSAVRGISAYPPRKPLLVRRRQFRTGNIAQNLATVITSTLLCRRSSTATNSSSGLFVHYYYGAKPPLASHSPDAARVPHGGRASQY